MPSYEDGSERGRTRPVRILVGVGSVALVTGVLAACGSSSPSSGQNGAGAGNKPTATVMVIGQLQASSFAVPEIVDGVTAAADDWNHRSGSKFRVKVVSCNDNASPNDAANCARNAVSAKVSAVVGAFSYFGTQIIPILAQAGIPYIGARGLVPLDFQSPDAYPIDGGIQVTFSALGEALAKAGCTKAAILRQNTAVNSVVDTYIPAGLKTKHVPVVKTIVLTSATADPTPQIQSAISAGANCLAVTSDPTVTPSVVRAAKQIDPSLIMGASSAAVTPALESSGDANGMLLADQYFPLNGKQPGIIKFKDAMKKYAPKASVDLYSVHAWGAMQLYLQAAQHTDKYDAKSIGAALNRLGTVHLGVVAPFDLSKPNVVPGLPRLFNTTVFIDKVVNGSTQLESTTGIDAEPILKSVAS